jgi:hypothetical protein
MKKVSAQTSRPSAKSFQRVPLVKRDINPEPIQSSLSLNKTVKTIRDYTGHSKEYAKPQKQVKQMTSLTRGRTAASGSRSQAQANSQQRPGTSPLNPSGNARMR